MMQFTVTPSAAPGLLLAAASAVVALVALAVSITSWLKYQALRKRYDQRVDRLLLEVSQNYKPEEKITANRLQWFLLRLHNYDDKPLDWKKIKRHDRVETLIWYDFDGSHGVGTKDKTDDEHTSRTV